MPNATQVPLSVLDLIAVSQGQSFRDAISASLEAVQLAEQSGYTRYWFAEHHNTASIASSATVVLIDRAASVTSTIRVGSGGIMAPNHSPLVVAEQFGTLVQLHGDRIDLGLGRAPGTDGLTSRLLNRTSAEPHAFAEAVLMMQQWMGPQGQPDGLPIQAGVARDTNVPMWMLSSTGNGGAIGAELGLPLSVAAHFAADTAQKSIATYRSLFSSKRPTAQITKPHVQVGVNVLVADTDAEARREFTSTLALNAWKFDPTAQRSPLTPPVDDLAATMPRRLVDALDHHLRFQAVGSPATARAQLQRIVEQTGADEIIAVSYAYDPAVRHRSLQLLADAWL